MKITILTLTAFVFTNVSCFAQNILAEHHFESSDIDKVVVDGSFCDVIVTRGDAVVFDGVIKGGGKKGDFSIVSIQNGKTVLFKVESNRSKGWSWSWNDGHVSKITLTIPKNVSLKVTNSSGDVSVDDYVGDLLEVNATSGDIELADIKTDLIARTTSGDFSVRRLLGSITMRSTSGDQDYEDITGSIVTNATSGGIEVENLLGNLIAEATSGDIEIDRSKGALLLRTTSGDIHGEYVTIVTSGKFRSTSGDIYFKLKNELETLQFDLSATSGDLEVGSISSEDDLKYGEGAISIRGVSTSGNQTYRN